MNIEHKVGVKCLIVSADTDRGRKLVGTSVVLLAEIKCGETVEVGGHSYVADDDGTWVIGFRSEVDGRRKDVLSIFHKQHLMPLIDPKNPQPIPDSEVLRLEDKRKKPGEGEV